MRKLILITLTFTIFIKALSAQTYTTYADTANYLINEIGAKKEFYMGKPFSKLYDSLKIKPVRFVNGNTDKKNFGNVAVFEFNLERLFSKSHFLVITFDSIPLYEVLFPILYPEQGVNRDFNTVINTYKPLNVKDIVVKDYCQDEDPDPNLCVE